MLHPIIRGKPDKNHSARSSYNQELGHANQNKSEIFLQTLVPTRDRNELGSPREAHSGKAKDELHQLFDESSA
jgi:hypothetical protein